MGAEWGAIAPWLQGWKWTETEDAKTLRRWELRGIKVSSELRQCNRSARTNKRLDSRTGRLALQSPCLPACLSLLFLFVYKELVEGRGVWQRWKEELQWVLTLKTWWTEPPAPSYRRDAKKKKFYKPYLPMHGHNTSFIDTYETNSFKFDLCVIRRKLDLVKNHFVASNVTVKLGKLGSQSPRTRTK